MALFVAPITPASALTLPGCFEGEFVGFADKILAFEGGATNVTGNFLLRNPTGTIFVGPHNIINGTLHANRIFLGTASHVTTCIANIVEGPGVCDNITEGPGTFVLPAACTFPPLPVPAFPGVCAPGTDFTVNAPGGLIPAGCYNKVRVNNGATATIAAGATVFTKLEFRVINGGEVASDTAGTRANIVTKALFVTEHGTTTLTDLNITSLGGPGNNFHIGNGTIVANTVSFSPSGEIHLHTGSQLRGDSELIASNLQLQPFTNENPPQLFCVCPNGFLIENGPPASWTDPTRIARTCQ
jgi:hypothetical protein